MNNLLTHYPINWIDGMKLSSRTHSYYTRHELQARASRGLYQIICYFLCAFFSLNQALSELAKLKYITMKTNQEILDDFGEMVVENCVDSVLEHFESLKSKENLPVVYETKKFFLDSLTEKQYSLFRKMLISSIEMSIFELFNIFEENEEFKIIYEEDGKQVDLVKISEMLKAELMIENGWIDRFSKYSDEKEE